MAILGKGGDTAVGAGTILGQHVLTCAHVLDQVVPAEGEAAPATRVNVRLPGGVVSSAELVVRVKNADSGIDLAILRVSRSERHDSPRCVSLGLTSDTQLEILGFPAGSQQSGSPVAVRPGASDQWGYRQIVGDGGGRIEQGFSGSGVYGINHNRYFLCGVVVTREATTLAYMLPIEHVVQVLSERCTDFRPEVFPEVILRFPHALEMVDEIRSTRAKRDQPIRFTTRVQLCDNASTLTGVAREETDTDKGLSPADFIEGNKATATYLMAQGGAGKTDFVSSCIEHVVLEGGIPFYLDVKAAVRGANEQALDDATGDEGVKQLFDRMAVGSEYAVFQQFIQSPDRPDGILVIDGLNETRTDRTPIYNVLQYVIDKWKSRLVVIAVDRLAIGRTAPTRFQLATIRALSRCEVQRVLTQAGHQESVSTELLHLLRIPFFLELYLTINAWGVSSRIGLLKRYFLRYLEERSDLIGVDAEAAEEWALTTPLSRLAYEAYSRGFLTFSRSDLDSLAANLSVRLLEVGMMMAEPSDSLRLALRHQLFHDFLAGWYLSQHPDDWGAVSFDALTLRAASADAIVFATESLRQGADGFISEVYDWNWQTAVSCISSLQTGIAADQTVSQHLIDAILAVIALKRFDRFAHTRKRTNEMAAVLAASPTGIPFAAAESEEELLNEVRKKYDVSNERVEPEYSEWKDLFLEDTTITSDMWPYLLDSPLLGWTAANIFKRSACSRDFVAYLGRLYRALYRSQRDEAKARTMRWRIVHVLGHAHPDAIKILSAVASDENEWRWSRFGAARSLAELASRCEPESDAEPILRSLAIAAPSLCRLSGGPGEIRKLCRLSDPSIAPWWRRGFLPILESGVQTVQASRDSQEAKEWEKCIREIKQEIS